MTSCLTAKRILPLLLILAMAFPMTSGIVLAEDIELPPPPAQTETLPGGGETEALGGQPIALDGTPNEGDSGQGTPVDNGGTPDAHAEQGDLAEEATDGEPPPEPNEGEPIEPGETPGEGGTDELESPADPGVEASSGDSGEGLPTVHSGDEADESGDPGAVTRFAEGAPVVSGDPAEPAMPTVTFNAPQDGQPLPVGSPIDLTLSAPIPDGFTVMLQVRPEGSGWMTEEPVVPVTGSDKSLSYTLDWYDAFQPVSGPGNYVISIYAFDNTAPNAHAIPMDSIEFEVVSAASALPTITTVFPEPGADLRGAVELHFLLDGGVPEGYEAQFTIRDEADVIAAGVLAETDTRYVWDTTAVPHGAYEIQTFFVEAATGEAAGLQAIPVDVEPISPVTIASPHDGGYLDHMMRIELTVWDQIPGSLEARVEVRPAEGEPILIDTVPAIADPNGSELYPIDWNALAVVGPGHYVIAVVADEPVGEIAAVSVEIAPDINPVTITSPKPYDLIERSVEFTFQTTRVPKGFSPVFRLFHRNAAEEDELVYEEPLAEPAEGEAAATTTYTFDPTALSTGQYTIRAGAYSLDDALGEDQVVPVWVSSSQDLRLSVQGPDGNPLPDVQVVFFHSPADDLRVAWEGWTGPAVFPYLFASPAHLASGHEYLAMALGELPDPENAHGIPFVVTQMVQPPGVVTLGGSDLRLVTFAATGAHEAPLTRIDLSPLLPGDVKPGALTEEPLDYPLDPSGQLSIYLPDGRYEITVRDVNQRALVSQRVTITESGTVPLPITAATGNLAFALPDGMELLGVNLWEQEGLQVALPDGLPGPISLPIGSYRAEFAVTVPGSDPGTEWQFLLRRDAVVIEADATTAITLGEFAIEWSSEGPVIGPDVTGQILAEFEVRDTEGNRLDRVVLAPQFTTERSPAANIVNGEGNLVASAADDVSVSWHSATWRVNPALPSGDYTLTVEAALPFAPEPLTITSDPLTINLTDDVPSGHDVDIRVLDEAGNDLTYAAIMLARYANGYYEPVIQTDGAQSSPIRIDFAEGAPAAQDDYVMVVWGMYEEPGDDLADNVKPFFFTKPLPAMSFPLDITVTVPTAELRKVSHYATDAVDGDRMISGGEWALHQQMPNGAYVGSVGPYDTWPGEIWTPAGTYRFDGRVYGGEWHLTTKAVTVSDDGLDLKFNTADLVPVDITYSEPDQGIAFLIPVGLFPYHIGPISMVSPGEYSIVVSSWVDDPSGFWQYGFIRPVEVPAGEPLSLMISPPEVKAALSLSQTTLRPGQEIAVTTSFADTNGTNLLFVQGDPEPEYGRISLMKKRTSTHEIAPWLEIIDPNGRTVFRYTEGLRTTDEMPSMAKLAAGQFGTYAGTFTYTLPSSAPEGTYQVKLSLNAGPLGALSATDSFTVSRPRRSGRGSPPRNKLPRPLDPEQTAREDGTYLITWPDTGDDDLKEIIIRVGDKEIRVPAGAHEYLLTGLAEGELYTMTIITVDEGGLKSDPATLTIETPKPPVGPPPAVAAPESGLHPVTPIVPLVPSARPIDGTEPRQGEEQAPSDRTEPLPKVAVQWDQAALGTGDPRFLALYRQSEIDPTEWTYVGGTVDVASGTLYASLTEPGNYAVMERRPAFTDTVNHPDRQAIELLASRQVIDGVGEGRFEPDRPVSRAELAKLLVTMLASNPGVGVSLTPPEQPTFADLPADHWSYAFVEAAHRLGLVQGWQGSFRPEHPVTREEMLAMLLRAAGLERRAATSIEASPFADAQATSPWATGYLAAGYQEGMVTGGADSAFRPTTPATRAEVASSLLRTMTYMGFINEPITVTGQVRVSDEETNRLELEVMVGGVPVVYTLFFYGHGAEKAAASAVGKEVTLRAITEQLPAGVGEGQPIMVLGITDP